MDDYSLVPVEHQPDFENVALVPVDHDPFSADGLMQQAPGPQAQAQPPQTTPTSPAQPAPLAQPQQPHDRIASHAMDQIGSEKWSDDAAKGFYKAHSNKCNLFVYDILTGAGASPGYPNGSWLFSYPPTAGQWANPNYPIRGWRVLGPEEAPRAGDVVTQKIDYRDASGHVMIVGPDGHHFIGTGTSAGQPHGTIVHMPPRDNLGPDGASHGPLVFRRFGE